MEKMSNFLDKAKGYAKNPLGIIALFISLIYGFACLVLSTSINNFTGPAERLPLIWFVILFPVLILIGFIYLVIFHHGKLYAPSDFKDEENFINVYMGNKEVSNDLNNIDIHLQRLKEQKKTGKDLDEEISEISNKIEKIKNKYAQIPINNLWKLNHWGSNCAKIVNNKMIFSGKSAPQGKDGSHIDLNNLLMIGKEYEVSCFAKSIQGTTGRFQLWCHDKTGTKPSGVSISTPYKTPSTEGEKIKLNFKATYNQNIRIHLQYEPGDGQIEVEDIQVNELYKNQL